MYIVLVPAGQLFFRDGSKFYKGIKVIRGKLYFLLRDKNTYGRESMVVRKTDAMEHKNRREIIENRNFLRWF